MLEFKVLKEIIKEEIKTIEKDYNQPLGDLQVGIIHGLNRSIHLIEILEVFEKSGKGFLELIESPKDFQNPWKTTEKLEKILPNLVEPQKGFQNPWTTNFSKE